MENRLDKLDKITRDKLRKLSYAREETEERVLDFLGEETIRRNCPKSISRYIRDLRRCSIADSGITDEGWAWVRLADGHVFYGHISKANHRKQFEFTKDLLPKKLTYDTFLCGIEVAHRYVTDGSWVPSIALPDEGGTVVECGAYLGHTALRFAEEVVGSLGRVLAIEMMPDNAMIMRRNIEINGRLNNIDMMEVGVWSHEQSRVVAGKNRQRNTLAPLDKFRRDDTGLAVKTLPLDTIFNQWGQERVDLLYITVNGAEVEALQGLNLWVNRVQRIVIRAPYMRDGQPTGGICRNLLEKKGFTIILSSAQDQFLVAEQ